MRRGLTARTVVGAVSQLYQGDWDFGRHVLERLAEERLPGDVALEPFDYGAVAVVQRLEDLRPERLIVVGTAERGRAPGSVTRRALRPQRLPPAIVGRAVADAVVGHVTMDLLVEVAAGLGALPDDAVTIELEPVRGGPSEELSREAAMAVAKVVALVGDEIVRAQPARSAVGAAARSPSA